MIVRFSFLLEKNQKTGNTGLTSSQDKIQVTLRQEEE